MQKGKIDFNKVAELVKVFAQDILNDLQSNLTKSDSIASGNLYQSITWEPLKVMKTGVMFELILDSYYKYVDEGVQGRDSSLKAPNSQYKFKNKRPPYQPIKEWLRTKGYKPKDEFITKSQKERLDELSAIKRKKSSLRQKLKKKTMDEIMTSFAIATAYNIQKNGLKATNFYSSVVNEERFEKFRKDISEAFKQDIIISIKE